MSSSTSKFYFSSVSQITFGLTAIAVALLATTQIEVTSGLFKAQTGGNTYYINQAWLDARGSGPYYLDEANATYILQTDVSTNGSAFVALRNDITLDLNNYTITYNNATPINIVNHSFELGTGPIADSWDFSNAPSATRLSGQKYRGEVHNGSYGIKFADLTTNQYIQNTQAFTLQPNTTYNLNGMFYLSDGNKDGPNNPGIKMYLKLIGQGSAPDRETAHTGRHDRGMQFTENKFTTGNTPEAYLLRVGIDGISSAPTNLMVFFDDIDVSLTNVYGVASSAYSWYASSYPDINQYGRAHRLIVKDGTINQGPDGAPWAHGVFASGNNGNEVRNMIITVHGPNSQNIKGYELQTPLMEIHNNTLYNNSDVVKVRDHFHGAAITAKGNISFNTIVGGPQNGIVAGRGHVHNNVISLNTAYTNGFGINSYAAVDMLIEDNDIDCVTGNSACRGIFIGGTAGSQNNTVRNNTIAVQLHEDSSEYFGCMTGGTYAMQFEESLNTQAYGNHITANADACDAIGFRAGGSNVAPTYDFYDNYVEANRIGANAEAATLKLSGINANGATHTNNLLVTNFSWIGSSTKLDGLTLEGNTLVTHGDTTSFEPFEVWNYFYSDPITLTVKNLTFVDNVYDSAATKQLFTDGIMENEFREGVPDEYSSFINSYTITFLVQDNSSQPLAGAAVTVTDNSSNTVFTGTTDSNGSAAAVIKEFKTTGDNKVSYAPHTVAVTYNSQQVEQSFTADDTKTIALNIDGGPTNLAPTVYAGPDTDVVVNQSLELGGTVTDDDLPNPPAQVATTWSKVSGPGNVTFGESTSVDTTAVFDTTGTYVLELTADDSMLTNSDTVIVEVGLGSPTNQAPIVDAGPDRTGLVGEKILIDGTITDEWPTSALKKSWSTFALGDASDPDSSVKILQENEEDTEVELLAPGVFTLTLKVSDNEYQVFDTMTLTILAEEEAKDSGEEPPTWYGSSSSSEDTDELMKRAKESGKINKTWWKVPTNPGKWFFEIINYWLNK